MLLACGIWGNKLAHRYQHGKRLTAIPEHDLVPVDVAELIALGTSCMYCHALLIFEPRCPCCLVISKSCKKQRAIHHDGVFDFAMSRTTYSCCRCFWSYVESCSVKERDEYLVASIIRLQGREGHRGQVAPHLGADSKVLSPKSSESE